MSTINYPSPRQEQAEAEFAPLVNKRGQHERIVEHLAQFGFITPLACIHRVPMITTKLSTRIGEIERKTGVQFKRTKMQPSRCMKYTCTPDEMQTLKDFYHIS